MSDQFSGVKDVSEHLKFDLTHLNTYLEENLASIGRVLDYKQFKGGQSNPTYLLEAEKGKFVLRRKPPGSLLKSAHAVDREYRVLTSLMDTDVPTPKTFLLCEDDKVIGTQFYIMEFSEGVIYWDPLASEAEKDKRKKIFDEMNKGIALLHLQDINKIGLNDFGKEGNYIERQISRWTRQYIDSETEKIDSMHRLIEWLPKKIPDQKYTSIVHGDYRLDNIVFDGSNNSIAILDWELSTIGDPLADFAYHCLLWHIGDISVSAASEIGIFSEKEYLENYLRRTNFKLENDWNFYIIFSLFKVAGICQGILGRVRDGTASSDFAIQMGKRAKMFADLGWEKAKKIL
ncbi:phosphotransferase family protein [SAR86 cluster bacterium]|jgi:aminoglycoside phosphotransferase (APT) family kinase protein|nr:phosphotransferase family protein [SAR86 cluster bacterium]